MNSELVKGILLFLAGGAVGGGTAAFVFKKKINDLEETYEDRLNEEIEEVRAGIEESYQERMERSYDLYDEDDDEEPEVDTEKLAKLSNKIVDTAKKARIKPDLMTYKDHLDKENYTSYSGKQDSGPDKNPTFDDTVIEPLEAMRSDIEVITPDEFGEMPGYDRENLYLLRDDVLVDDSGRPVENISTMIGPDALEEIGVYESDAVFVRNHAQETDYAIFLRDETLKNFSL